jgi:hypothetical protein
VRKIANREKWDISIVDPKGGGAEFVIDLHSEKKNHKA